MTRWPGRSAGCALPAKTTWTGRVLVEQHPGQPVDVAEQQAGPLVGREPAGEADGQHVRIERCLELGQDRRRFAVPGELAAQPATREMGQLALLAEVRVPQVPARDAFQPLPEAAALGALVEVVEVGTEVLEQLGDRLADPGRAVDPVGDAQDRAGRRCPARSRWPSARGGG